MNIITIFMLFYICFSLFRIKLECQRFILESGWKGNQLVELVLCKLAVVQIYSFFAKDARKLQKSYLKDEEKKDNKKNGFVLLTRFFCFLRHYCLFLLLHQSSFQSHRRTLSSDDRAGCCLYQIILYLAMARS